MRPLTRPRPAQKIGEVVEVVDTAVVDNQVPPVSPCHSPAALSAFTRPSGGPELGGAQLWLFFEMLYAPGLSRDQRGWVTHKDEAGRTILVPVEDDDGDDEEDGDGQQVEFPRAWSSQGPPDTVEASDSDESMEEEYDFEKSPYHLAARQRVLPYKNLPPERWQTHHVAAWLRASFLHWGEKAAQAVEAKELDGPGLQQLKLSTLGSELGVGAAAGNDIKKLLREKTTLGYE